jgi:uncharacterized delta-60 repeat protein
VTSFGPNRTNAALAVATQADGKIVAAGFSGVDVDEFALARYTVHGRLDPTFGAGGRVLTSFGGEVASAVAIQADGKIVAAGWGERDYLALARYTPEGRLDPSFGTGGKVLTRFGEPFDADWVLAIQRDGRIVAAGAGGNEFALARYTPDGRLDPSFGSGGKVLTGFRRIAGALAVAILRDGKIVAAGWSSTDPPDTPDLTNAAFAAARYTRDGRLDPSFGSGGKVLTDFVGSDFVRAVALQEDGKIVAAGLGGRDDLALARYTPNGRLDPGFGAGGQVVTQFSQFDTPAVTIQPDGKIVVAGSSRGDFALARYTPEGRLDPGFGTGGKVVTSFGPPTGASAVTIQADGRIVAAGSGFQCQCGWMLARYMPDGRLDSG